MKAVLLAGVGLIACCLSGDLRADDVSVDEMKKWMVAVTSVQALGRQMDGITAYCSERFPDTKPGMTQASDAWHVRNGAWERAADALRGDLRDKMVARDLVADAATFERTLETILGSDVAKLRAKMENISTDDERRVGCIRFVDAIAAGQLDVETRWSDALPVLRPFLK